MYLTKARLVMGESQAGAVAAMLAKQGQLDRGHSLIWTLMSKQGPERDFLYRQTDTSPPAFFILSSRVPESHYDFWRIETKPFEPKISVGDRLSFLLRVSPAIRKGRGAATAANKSPAAGKRHDVLMDAKSKKRLLGKGAAVLTDEEIHDTALAWLTPRATRCGFEVDGAVTRVSGYHQIAIASTGDANFQAKFSVIDYDGVLTVKDPAAFLHTLLNGIGPQKSYGCGMLLIMRL